MPAFAHQVPTDRLVAATRCLAAVFTSFTFDPAFFEEQLLPGILHLSSDPQEQTERFLEEGRRVLQEVPVACIVDASMRQPGHRLPYDLLEVSGRTFHPKVSLVLYEGFARLQVGSGNLTRGGHGGNTELFFSRELRYESSEDVALLRQVDRFLESIAALVRRPGTQLALVRDELNRRTAGTASGQSEVVFLHTEDGPLLAQFLELIPEHARPVSAGALAPFLERDDLHIRDSDPANSALLSLASFRGGRHPLDVGVLWEDPPLIRSGAKPVSIGAHLNQLWCHRVEARPHKLEYLTPTEVSERRVRFRDRHGEVRQDNRAELEALIEADALWPVPELKVHAPANVMAAIAERGSLGSLWLHPARRFEDEQPVNRPLHAKLYLVAGRRGQRTDTFVLLGSPNASRRALLDGPEEAGNIEAAVAFVMEGEHRLHDLVPELVACDLENTRIMERVFPAAETNWALVLESVTHDPRARTLDVVWAAPKAWASFADRAWELKYLERSLAVGTGIPDGPTQLQGFDLHASCCEVVLVVNGIEFTAPILVTDLVELPAEPALRGLSLAELLALAGHRVDRERLGVHRAAQGSNGATSLLAAIFGEGFGPADVFRAWHSLEKQLAAPGQSVAGFKLRLNGAFGAWPIWLKLREAVESSELSREEAWFYGAELLRGLAAVPVPEQVERKAKLALLRDFTTRLRSALEPLAPDSSADSWLERVRRFYEVLR